MAATTITPDVLGILRGHVATDGPRLKITLKIEDRTLYARVNKVLEALGGKWNRSAQAHVFPEDAAPLIADVVANGKYVDPIKENQFYPTPPEVVARMIDRLPSRLLGRALEPSAGSGAILAALVPVAKIIVAVEKDPKTFKLLKRRELATNGEAENVTLMQADFLSEKPETHTPYDAIVMNPPFTRGQDMQHVRHAYEFLAPGGTLVAIMALGFTFRNDRKAVEFREWVEEVGEWEDLPPGSFASSGTNVSTVIVTIRK